MGFDDLEALQQVTPEDKPNVIRMLKNENEDAHTKGAREQRGMGLQLNMENDMLSISQEQKHCMHEVLSFARNSLLF